jgi:hypothetical protein
MKEETGCMTLREWIDRQSKRDPGCTQKGFAEQIGVMDSLVVDIQPVQSGRSFCARLRGYAIAGHGSTMRDALEELYHAAMDDGRGLENYSWTYMVFDSNGQETKLWPR